MPSLGAFRSPPDARDYKYPRNPQRSVLPKTLDLRPKLFSIRDQGSQGSCVAQAGACMKEYQEAIQINLNEHLSPQYIYNHRPNYPEEGMYGRDLMEILLNHGISQERYFPYQTKTKPDQITAIVKQDALNFRIKSYAIVNYIQPTPEIPEIHNENIIRVKQALVENGPCVILMPAFNYNRNFWIQNNNQPQIGGHAVAVVGYDEFGFILRNSWGSSWASGGYTTYSYADFQAQRHWEIWTSVDDLSNTIVPPPQPKKCQCVLL